MSYKEKKHSFNSKISLYREDREKYTKYKNMCILLTPLTLGLTLPGYFLFDKKINELSNEINKYSQGMEAELNMQKALSKLPQEYTVLSDIMIKNDDSVAQIDNVVIGPNGIFLVEVKKMKGRVSGKIDDLYLYHNKKSAAGAQYDTEFYNPLKQVNVHAYKLYMLLKKFNIYTFVNGLVFFDGSDVQIQMNGETPKIFSSSDGDAKSLMDFITSYQCKKSALPNKKIRDRITKIIESNQINASINATYSIAS